MEITVIIPLHNKEETILRSVRSVLKQTYQEFELVIVDDGSTDNSLEALQDISDSRIRLFSQKNLGVSVARNKGVNEANNEWVTFLDADDEYMENFLQSVIDVIVNDNDKLLSFVGTHYDNRQSETEPLCPIGVSGNNFFKLFNGSNSPVHSSSVAVRRAPFLSVGGYVENQTQFEDWTLYFKLATIGGFCYISKTHSTYHNECRDGSEISCFEKFYDNAKILPEYLLDRKVNQEWDRELRKDCGEAMNRYVAHVTLTLLRARKKRLAAQFIKMYLCAMTWSIRGSGEMLLRCWILFILPLSVRNMLKKCHDE